ncbi:MAG: alpha/beta hydrolase [Faecalicatena sp.]|uniref:subtype B tannase n=1 Tax=Faecalicatena sp. TaxID=2005360 RepID=UPI0025835DFC|nr:subtype B tannase [Faecalicatena sp.]MCI6465685.1 alpha/beta hydrolase [Faecalicatena sp.]MDY5618040.1 subtype B tannase [Lachnospiraceae bacterium]
MKDPLIFDPDRYEVKTCTLDQMTITYRAFENLSYCADPVDEIQKMNLFVPEAYYHGETIQGYDLHSAPIFAYNTVGGYMPGAAGKPEKDFFDQRNGIFEALRHGYVVASPGIRGRVSEKDGAYTGKAPALIVDMKAAIRYLRHNQNVIPGDTKRIITNGTSAGGALSALTGASGNSADYLPYLKEIGAAEERDDIFAACCFCPIHNLEHADAAYEWTFCGHNTVSDLRYDFQDGLVTRMYTEDRPLTEKQICLSKQLKSEFITYVNSLSLRDDSGQILSLDENGEGSFKDYVLGYLAASARKEYDMHHMEKQNAHLMKLLPMDARVEKQNCIHIDEKGNLTLDWDSFLTSVMRAKPVPAFDALDLSTCENNEYGSRDMKDRHFTQFSYERSEADGELAPEEIVKMMNPTRYIGQADTAPNWWIRHSTHDCAASYAIPVILAAMLKNQGCNVNFEFPWGLPHCGDYGLDEMFAWIDELCSKQ